MDALHRGSKRPITALDGSPQELPKRARTNSLDDYETSKMVLDVQEVINQLKALGHPDDYIPFLGADNSSEEDEAACVPTPTATEYGTRDPYKPQRNLLSRLEQLTIPLFSRLLARFPCSPLSLGIATFEQIYLTQTESSLLTPFSEPSTRTLSFLATLYNLQHDGGPAGYADGARPGYPPMPGQLGVLGPGKWSRVVGNRAAHALEQLEALAKQAVEEGELETGVCLWWRVYFGWCEVGGMECGKALNALQCLAKLFEGMDRFGESLMVAEYLREVSKDVLKRDFGGW